MSDADTMARELPAALAPLTGQRRWVVWRWQLDNRGKRTKVPYQPDRPGAKAESNSPGTWGEYATALKLAAGGVVDGIGYMLADGEIVAFDLDHCRDPATGDIDKWAWDLIVASGSYTEVTVSGTGLRIIGRGIGGHVHRKFAIPGTAEGSLEAYRKARRYIVVTGDHLPGSYDELKDLDGLVDDTVARFDPKKSTSSDTRSEQPHGPRNVPPDLDELVRTAWPDGERSEKFYHAVGWLKDLGYSPDEIEATLAAHPDGVAAKYAGRLRQEIDRAFGKAEDKPSPGGQEHAASPESDGVDLRWHGEVDDRPLREWLVDKTLFKSGTALLSGQWGTYKTFVAFDLSACVMTMRPFAGRPVTRQGGVLFVAVEGQDEVRIRLEGVIGDKVRPALDEDREIVAVDPEHMPFVWVETCPKLTNPDAVAALRKIVAVAAQGMQDRFGLPLVLMMIDTLSPAAEFKDANDTAENQRVMSVLKTIAREFEMLVMAVDHFGKDVSTGTRNSSVKESDVDSVLALLGDKDLAGNVGNTRLAIRKVRGAPTGSEIQFDKRVVTVGAGFDTHTTLVIDWRGGERSGETVVEKPSRWPRSLTVFKRALDVSLTTFGKKMRPFLDGPEVLAVERDRVRDEFFKAYPADNQAAKKQAFLRCERQAVSASIMCSREVGGPTFFWILADDPSETKRHT